MKNQLLNLKMIALMCLMMVLGGANVWAESKTYNYTFKSGDFSTSKLTSTLNGVTWTLKVNQWKGTPVFSFDTNDTKRGFKIGSSSTKYPKDATLSTSEIGGTITSIVVNTSGNSGTTAKLDVMIGGKAFGKQQSLTGNAQNLSFNGSASGQIELKYSNSSTPIYIKSIAVTYETAPAKTLTSLAISGTPTKTTYNVGEEFDPAGLVVTGTYEDNTTAPITGGITWTKNPEKMSLGNTSCTVTASVGGVQSESYVVNGLNVVKAIVFDFTATPNAWGITPSSNNVLTGNNVIAGKKLEVDGVVMTATNGDSFGTCIYKTNNKGQLRVYSNGGSITFTAPSGFNLSEINFAGSSLDKFTSNEENYTSTGTTATWNGNAHAVTFSASSGVKVNTATIKLVAVEPAQPTFGTLDFKAQDGEELHYATFSSDKNVVFNQEDVYVCGVSVSNGKVIKNYLTDASYNVTDATVGSMKGYYVPANTGVLIEGFDATTTYYFPVETQTVTLLANQLKPAPANGGVFEATAGYKYYKLAYDNYDTQEGLGFYWGAPEGGKFFVKAGTAYLAVPAGDATAKGFAFNGEATGIDGVNANVENAKAIYNLNGQRVASMAKPGLYIVNGKKMIVRK